MGDNFYTIGDNISTIGYTSLMIYISFTFIFFVLKFSFLPEDNISWVFLFLFLSYIIQTGFNVGVIRSQQICQASHLNAFSISAYNTFIPWIMIFTSFALIITIFPGWLRAFSNTFGLYAAQAYGLQEVINNIFTSTERTLANSRATVPTPNIQLLKSIDSVYSMPTTIINELDPKSVRKHTIISETQLTSFLTSEENKKKFYDFDNNGNKVNPTFQNGLLLYEWSSLDKLNPDYLTNPPSQSDIKNLLRIVELKDTVGYFFWFLFVGSMCSIISVNSILAGGCDKTNRSTYDIIFNVNK
jgi:hypothetical protein